MPTDGNGTQAALWIAMAGGAGAFLGALLGQLVQWVRDVQRERRIDRRRQEDVEEAIAREQREHRRNDYMYILRFLSRLRGRLALTEFVANIGEHDPAALEGAAKNWGEVGRLVREEWEEAVARTEVSGSERAFELMDAFGSFLTQFMVQPSASRLESRDWPAFDAAFKQAREEGVSFDPLEHLEQVAMTNPERAASIVDSVQQVLEELATIQGALRAELRLD